MISQEGISYDMSCFEHDSFQELRIIPLSSTRYDLKCSAVLCKTFILEGSWTPELTSFAIQAKYGNCCHAMLRYSVNLFAKNVQLVQGRSSSKRNVWQLLWKRSKNLRKIHYSLQVVQIFRNAWKSRLTGGGIKRIKIGRCAS